MRYTQIENRFLTFTDLTTLQERQAYKKYLKNNLAKTILLRKCVCVEGVGVGWAPAPQPVSLWSPAVQESRVGWVEPGVEPKGTHHMQVE